MSKHCKQGWRWAVATGSALALGWLVGLGCSSSSARKEPDLRLLGEAWDKIQQEYVGRDALHSKDLTYGAIAGMVDAFRADPERECASWTARERLERCLRVADEAGLAVPRLRKIRSELA